MRPFKNVNIVGKKLDEESPPVNTGLEVSKSGLFKWGDTRVYKYSISKGQNKIWIQFVKEEIDLFSNHYFQEGTDGKFQEIAKSSKINRKNKS
jgi:hypothetical protein